MNIRDIINLIESVTLEEKKKKKKKKHRSASPAARPYYGYGYGYGYGYWLDKDGSNQDDGGGDVMEAEFTAYHGTNKKFDKFKEQPKSKTTFRLGFYFASNRRFAEIYGKNLVTAKLTMDNPLNVVGMDAWSLIELLPLPDMKKRELRSAYRKGTMDYQQYGLLEAGASVGLQDALKAQGYDGIIYTEGYADSYIVFDEDQIEIVNQEPSDR